MRITVRRAVTISLSAVTLLLAGCAAADPEPVVPQELTTTKAGGLYLSAVCPVNAAWDAVDLEVDRLRLALGRGDADADATALAGSLRAVARASESGASALAPKDVVWPAEAESAIDEVRQTLRADSKQALRVAKLSPEQVAEYEWQGAGEIAEAAAAARRALRLPSDAETACAQWE